MGAMTLTAAVIGCGRMGAFTGESVRRWSPEFWLPLSHADALDAHPDVDLVAAADPSPDALQRMRVSWPGVRTFTNVADLATSIQPTLAGIATRTLERTDVLETLHAAGTRAFHIEKPLCNSMDQLARLETLLGRDDTHVTYGAMRRTFDVYRTAVEIAESGRLGALREIRVNFGSAPLYWTQAHAIDLILFGARGRQVSQVQARLGPVEVEGSAIMNDPVVQSATIWFDDGVAGNIGRAPGLDFILSCDDGEVIVRSDGRSLEIAATDGDDPYLHRTELAVEPAAPLGALRSVTQLVDCLQGVPPALKANAVIKQDILLGQRIAFGLVQSHLSGGSPLGLGQIDDRMIIWARTGGRYA
jgi:scyllo-inositol 2-dehydrogenase (NAD+)